MSPVAGGHSPKVPLGASLLAIGAGATWSFGAPIARSAQHADAWQYLIWRSIGVIVVVEVLTLLRHERPRLPRAFRSGPVVFVATLGLLAASFGFIYAVKNTTVANASFLASITPIIAIVISRIVLNERLTAVTIGAICLALVGLTITVAGDLQAGNLKGNAAALLSALGFAVYAVCVRSDPSADWAPVLPGYAFLMILLCGSACLVDGRTLLPPRGDVLLALFHGSVLIVIGTLLFNASALKVPAVAMAVFAQTELVLAPIWVFLKFGERPRPTTVLGGALILTAVIGKAVLDANDVGFRRAGERIASPS
jgi:drug/metabolite transporter, DME family